jgi:hypothetical protein
LKKVKIVMTCSRPGYPPEGQELEVDETRAERWCEHYGIAQRAGRRRVPAEDAEPPPFPIPEPVGEPDRSERRLMGLVVVTPPAAEPISLAEFKLAARVTNAAEDDLITDILIPAARRRYETDTRRQIVTATYDWFFQDFPPQRAGEDSRIEIPVPPLASIVSVKYVDVDGVLQTLDSSKYVVTQGKEPGQIYPAQAIMLLALHWFENREAVIVDERVAIQTLPLGYETLSRNRQITAV